VSQKKSKEKTSSSSRLIDNAIAWLPSTILASRAVTTICWPSRRTLRAVIPASMFPSALSERRARGMRCTATCTTRGKLKVRTTRQQTRWECIRRLILIDTRPLLEHDQEGDRSPLRQQEEGGEAGWLAGEAGESRGKKLTERVGHRRPLQSSSGSRLRPLISPLRARAR
jgi:hypothetical protein